MQKKAQSAWKPKFEAIGKSHKDETVLLREHNESTKKVRGIQLGLVAGIPACGNKSSSFVQHFAPRDRGPSLSLETGERPFFLPFPVEKSAFFVTFWRNLAYSSALVSLVIV